MLIALALVAAAQTAPPAPAPAPTVAVERTVIDVLAFSDDGTQALAQETTTAGATKKTTLLLVNSGGVGERLPISFRTDGLMQDGVSAETCRASADRIAAMAKDLRGVTVTIGLCSSNDRRVVDVMGRPNPAVLSQKIGAYHAKVGFPGRTFVAPSGPLVVVVGSDAFGNDRLGTTRKD